MRKISSIGIMKWMYFLHNHGDIKEIISKVFPDLAEHLYGKYCQYVDMCNNTIDALILFYMNLDTQRQIEFGEWVCENYSGVDNRIEKLNDLDESGSNGLWDEAGAIAVVVANTIRQNNVNLQDGIYAEDCGQEMVYERLKRL